jgi:hypothetical protein
MAPHSQKGIQIFAALLKTFKMPSGKVLWIIYILEKPIFTNNFSLKLNQPSFKQNPEEICPCRK